jgi:hypothetical protein
VCLSVISIPKNLLNPGFYTIKTFNYEERHLNQQLKTFNYILSLNIDSLSKNKEIIELVRMQKRTHNVYLFLDSLENDINKNILKNDMDIQRLFDNTRVLDNYFKNGDVATEIKNKIQDLFKDSLIVKKLNDKEIAGIFPLDDKIVAYSGKVFDWQHYLLLHKPVAISYEQFKRMKTLLLTLENKIAEAEMEELGYTPAFYNEITNKMVLQSRQVKNFEKENKELKLKADSVGYMQSLMNDQMKERDSLFRALFKIVFEKKYYVGISNVVFDNDKMIYPNSKYTIKLKSPDSSAFIKTEYGSVYVKFKRQGKYGIFILDNTKGNGEAVFEKDIYAYNLPDPYVVVENLNADQRYVSIGVLLKCSRLVPKINLPQISTFPGTILSFRASKKTADGKGIAVQNTGAVFNPDTQNLISSIQLGDVLIFDNILIRLNDETTRVANSLVIKVTN